MRTRESNFSKDEDKVILESVKANFSNIQEALRKASAQLPNRSFKSIGARWYNHLKKNCETYKLVSSNKELINIKIKRSNTIVTPISLEESTFLKFAKANKINLLELRAKIVEDMVIKYRKSLEE